MEAELELTGPVREARQQRLAGGGSGTGSAVVRPSPRTVTDQMQTPASFHLIRAY